MPRSESNGPKWLGLGLGLISCIQILILVTHREYMWILSLKASFSVSVVGAEWSSTRFRFRGFPAGPRGWTGSRHPRRRVPGPAGPTPHLGAPFVSVETSLLWVDVGCGGWRKERRSSTARP